MDQQAFAQLLGNYGEFLGSLAVLVTLVYLSVQIRQAKNQMNLAGRQARADAARDVTRMMADMAPILAKLEQSVFPSLGDFGLNPEETIQYYAWCHMWMKTEEMNFKATVAPEEQATQRQLLKLWLSIDSTRAFWQTNKALYDESFASLVDECGLGATQSPESIMSTRQ